MSLLLGGTHMRLEMVVMHLGLMRMWVHAHAECGNCQVSHAVML